MKRYRAFLGTALLGLAFVSPSCGTYKPRPARVPEMRPIEGGDAAIIYMQPVVPSTRTVVSKNYTLGARRTAAVGEPMVGVRNYTAADQVVAAVALRDFHQLCRAPEPPPLGGGGPSASAEPLSAYYCQSGRLSRVKAVSGDRLEVGGAFTDQGKTFYLIRLPTDEGSLYLATDRRGLLRPDGYLAWRSDSTVTSSRNGIPLEVLKTPVKLESEGPLFRYVTEETVVPQGADHLNYELIYRGTTQDHRGTAYHILYKEYRRDSVQVPIYNQDLPFAAGSTNVDVLGLRIRVHDVDAKRIVYTVERD